MAKQKKEREPFFTQAVFNDAQYAMDMKEKAEKKIQKSKIGLIVAAIAEVMMLIFIKFENAMGMLSLIPFICWIVCAIGSYIVGGGLKLAIKGTFKIAKTIAYIGWFVVPFPADIFTGIMLGIIAIVYIPLSFVFIPLILVFLNYLQVKKDYDAAVEYLKYCNVTEE